MLFEQVIPQFFLANKHDFDKVNQLHNLLMCLNQKVAWVFLGSTIDAIFDANWDYKAMVEILINMFFILGLEK